MPRGWITTVRPTIERLLLYTFTTIVVFIYITDNGKVLYLTVSPQQNLVVNLKKNMRVKSYLSEFREGVFGSP